MHLTEGRLDARCSARRRMRISEITERVHRLSRRATRCRETTLGSGKRLDRSCARLTLLDRSEHAVAAQRQAVGTLCRDIRGLPRQNKCVLAGLEVGDFDLAAEDVDPRATAVDRNPE